jgi:hypothetical protein
MAQLPTIAISERRRTGISAGAAMGASRLSRHHRFTHAIEAAAGIGEQVRAQNVWKL